MDLYARVNILEGKAVRLPRGDVTDAIFLDADPVGRAKGWVAKGADRLFIVDLDAAVHGDYRNRPLIRRIIEASDVPVQVGGGVRSPQEVERALEAGAWRVVMGTAAIENQIMVWEICRDHPGKIVVSIDVHDDEEIATRGWTFNSGRYLEEVLIEMSAAGAAAFMIAEVGRDALEEPPNFDSLKRAVSIVDEPVVAGGGVRNLEDLRQLRQLEAGGRGLDGVVVGREVTAGRFTIEDAATILRDPAAHDGPWSVEDLTLQLARYRQYLQRGGDASDAKAALEQAEGFINWLSDN